MVGQDQPCVSQAQNLVSAAEETSPSPRDCRYTVFGDLAESLLNGLAAWCPAGEPAIAGHI